MSKRIIPIFSLAAFTFLACLLVATVLHEPIPRVHDEFSYLLMADTFANGHISNPTPPHSEFFDTFHVLMRPFYVSKYFPAQGVFLAVGEKLTGRPIIGVWLSSALACGATYWMMESWIGADWALFGAFLMVIQYGIYSYWSQTYWGGMVAALGGALAFGGAHRLWSKLSWTSSVWLAFGIVILVDSRPFEGLLALLPVTMVFLIKALREKLWHRSEFWIRFVLPAGIVLAIGAFLTGSYNRAITASFWKPPYLLHENQYQETPQFTFLPLRPKISYSSAWVQYYYEHWEMARYQRQRDPRFLITVSAGKIVSWWYFFCGMLLTPCLILPGLLKRTNIRYAQAGIAATLGSLWLISGPNSIILRGIFDFLLVLQVVILWQVFESFWTRLALLTCSLLLVEASLIKWFFPHYVAPVACLILFLQVDGARRIWEWNHKGKRNDQALSRSERRRLARAIASNGWFTKTTRGYVCLLPALCVISLVLRVEGRINNWKSNELDTDNLVLRMDDWSSHRAELERWLNEQPGQQIVFVAYSAHHNVNFEWVYNHADLIHSHVIWARNLGPDHNRLLLQDFPSRTVWLVEADRRESQLIPYSELDSKAVPAGEKMAPTQGQGGLDW